jgi:hypothetical protein
MASWPLSARIDVMAVHPHPTAADQAKVSDDEQPADKKPAGERMISRFRGERNIRSSADIKQDPVGTIKYGEEILVLAKVTGEGPIRYGR